MENITKKMKYNKDRIVERSKLRKPSRDRNIWLNWQFAWVSINDRSNRTTQNFKSQRDSGETPESARDVENG